MRTLVVILVLSSQAPSARAGGCDGPTVAVIDVSPARAPLPANGNWDARTFEAIDRFQADLVAAVRAHPRVHWEALARPLTQAETARLRALVLKSGAGVPRGLRLIRPGDRRSDTVILLHVPRDLLQPSTIAIVGLHEGRVAARLHGRDLLLTPALIPALADLAAATLCSV